MRVAIITSGYFPIPAVKGGAVEALDEYLIEKNEQYKKFEFEIISIYDKKASEISKKYTKTNFIFIKVPVFIKKLDILIYNIVKNVLKKEKHMSYRYIIQRLYFINKTSRILSTNNYDKIIIENHPTLFIALKKRKNYKKYEGKYYYHLHNEVQKDYGCKDIILNSEKILGVSRYINSTLSKVIGSIDERKLDLLKNCVDISKFCKEKDNTVNELKNKFKIEKNEKVLLFTGRLNKEKGIKELLLAIKKVKNTNFKLLIVGSYYYDSGMISKFEEELKELSEQMKEKIIFTGFIPYNEIPSIYSIADISIIPSIWNDPAPLTVIESMASELPIITTDSGGIPEYVNEKCAIILKRDDNLINNLAMSIDKLLSDKELRKRMSLESRRLALELNLDNYYNNFMYKIIE